MRRQAPLHHDVRGHGRAARGRYSRVMDGFGGLLKRWRVTRRLSQEALAFQAEISTRHLSYLENGRSKPSREMVLVLSNALELELRERNTMLTSAGFAPVYSSNALESLAMAPVRKAIELLLAKQEPYGAVLVDRAWNVLQLNEGATRMLGAFLDAPMERPNVIRALMDPRALRPSIVNWHEVATAVVERLERECAMFPTDELRHALRDELRHYPGVEAIRPVELVAAREPVVQVHLRRGGLEARLFTMLTTIGTPLDVTAQELMIESYFPADDATARWLEGLAG